MRIFIYYDSMMKTTNKAFVCTYGVYSVVYILWQNGSDQKHS